MNILFQTLYKWRYRKYIEDMLKQEDRIHETACWIFWYMEDNEPEKWDRKQIICRAKASCYCKSQYIFNKALARAINHYEEEYPNGKPPNAPSNLYIRNNLNQAKRTLKILGLSKEKWMPMGIGQSIVGYGFDKIVYDVNEAILSETQLKSYKDWRLNSIKCRLNNPKEGEIIDI